MKTRHLLLASFTAIATVSQAALPLGGLTVAVSPDGKKLVAGGDTRTLLMMDPASLEVTARQWIEAGITSLGFSKDGKVLVVGDSDNAVKLFDTASWKLIKQFEKYDLLTISQSAGLFAGTDNAYTGPNIFVSTIEGGVQKAKITLGNKERVVALAISPDGQKLAVLTYAKEDPSEKKLGYNDIPKDLTGLDRAVFQLKNDGKASTIFIYDIQKGTVLSERKTWYENSNNCRLLFHGDDVIAVGYMNVNAQIAPDGTTKAFEAMNSYNYGIGFSADGKSILTGGLVDGTITAVTSLSGVKFKLSKISGFPEYIKGFDSSASGTVFAGTSGFRVVRISADGKVEKEAPVK